MDVGTTGLSIQQTDTYVVGDEYYTTDVKISNNGAARQAVSSIGRVTRSWAGPIPASVSHEVFSGNRKAVGCSVNANNLPPGKIEELIPLTGGNNYFQDEFDIVWSAIGSKMPFPDTCACTTSWTTGPGSVGISPSPLAAPPHTRT